MIRLGLKGFSSWWGNGPGLVGVCLVVILQVGQSQRFPPQVGMWYSEPTQTPGPALSTPCPSVHLDLAVVLSPCSAPPLPGSFSMRLISEVDFCDSFSLVFPLRYDLGEVFRGVGMGVDPRCANPFVLADSHTWVPPSISQYIA